VKTLHVPLLDKREIAKNTYLFSFPKPADFFYTAGQYISLSIDPPDIAAPGGTMREFSLSSAPYEPILTTAFRFRASAAKKQFLALEKGDRAYIQGPFGNFSLQNHDKQVVFLVGGIGIVPLLSMLKQSLHEKENRIFTIYFSNRREEDIPFLPELELLIKQHRAITLVNTLTLERPHHRNGESGYISAEMIRKHTTHPEEAYYYLSGPQRFVGGMWEVLGSLNVSETHIHGEEFTGY
jgi:ferredoxin-NADP reductase